MNLRAFHAWFLVSACALLLAVIVWIPAAGALGSTRALGAWVSAIFALVGLMAYLGARRSVRTTASSTERA